MKKEIGGYFELEQIQSGFDLYADLLKFNSARNAFAYLLRKTKPTKVYLPFYLCPCILKTCQSENIRVEFYHINDKFIPILDSEPEDNDLLYIVNYFGLLETKTISHFKRVFKFLVLDNVQAFFTKPMKGIDTIYSCRKFFGVPDGGYLSTLSLLDEKIGSDDSKNRFTHLAGRLNGDAHSFYYEFKHNEQVIDTLPVLKMSNETDNIMSNIDYSSVRKIREQNYTFLDNNLKGLNRLRNQLNPGPFCYPFLFKKGKELKKILIENKVYIPTLWPDIDMRVLSILERDFVENLIAVPCDQRYSFEEMQFICDIILKYARNQ